MHSEIELSIYSIKYLGFFSCKPRNKVFHVFFMIICMKSNRKTTKHDKKLLMKKLACFFL